MQCMQHDVVDDKLISSSQGCVLSVALLHFRVADGVDFDSWPYGWAPVRSPLLCIKYTLRVLMSSHQK